MSLILIFWGKTISKAKRKKFFSLKQFITSIGLLISAFSAGYILKQFVFPNNYSLTFTMAASLLLIASLGFYFLSEKVPSPKRLMGVKDFFAQMPHEIKTNSNLRNYLIIINMLGIGVSLLPFCGSSGQRLWKHKPRKHRQLYYFQNYGNGNWKFKLILFGKKL